MLKVGVIGTGAIANARHLPEYRENARVEIVALCDIDEAKLTRRSKKYSVSRVYTDYRQLLADPEVQAVSICTPNYLHAPMAIAAAEAGKHVLVEKPMATSLREADAMIAAAKKAGVVLMVGQNQRLAPLHKLAKEVIQGGTIGRVNTIRTTFGHPGPEFWSPTGSWFFEKKKAFAGSLADLGIHKADLIRWILEDDVVEAAAFTACREKKNCEVDDNATCILRFKQGAMAVLETSWTYKPKEDNSTIFYGEKGTLKLAAEPGKPIVVYLSSPGRGELVFEAPSLQSNEKGGQFNTGVIDGFVNSILDGGEPPVPGCEGRRALEIILACLQSDETKTVVRLPMERA